MLYESYFRHKSSSCSQIHNRRVLDFTKTEEYMERMRYDISDKVMTLMTHEVLEHSRMLTIKS